MDTSKELDANGIKTYQSLIVITMSCFRVAQLMGHLECLKRIYGYLKQFRTAAIRVLVEAPDYFTASPDQNFNWCYNVYCNVKEVLPKDLPKALGNPVIMVTYKDANLYHDMVTGHLLVTGVLHFYNQTLFYWYSKRQSDNPELSRQPLDLSLLK